MMLEQLNTLRSEGNRNRLSYLIFTKLLPHVLGRQHQLETTSKFYDLFRHQIYALEPYTLGDAQQMLTYLNEGAGRRLTQKDLVVIRWLAGGHSRLLKLLFDLCSQEGLPASDLEAHFAAKPDVQQECERILAGLHEAERQAAVQVAKGGAADPDIVDHLARRGLIVNLNPPTWFSPVMLHYLRHK